jgi:hypothetical protein
MVLLFAAHQGEEFVLILPAAMLLGALLLLRWANQPAPEDSSGGSTTDDVESDNDPGTLEHPQTTEEPDPVTAAGRDAPD